MNPELDTRATAPREATDSNRKPVEPEERPRARHFATMLSPRNIGAIYLLILIVAIFSIWIPDLFLTTRTAKNIVNQNAITAIAALSLVVPLACGVFDLSIGAVMGFAGILSVWLLRHGVHTWPAATAITLGVCLLIGAGNATLVSVVGIDSFIGTLAAGAIVTAITSGISGDQIIFAGNNAGGFTSLATSQISGVTLPVVYTLVLMIVLGLLLERTALGRFCYAAGFNSSAARLSGVPTRAIRAGALMSSATIAGFAGVVLTARIGTADPTTGPSYLIPAFAAAFTGATQLRHGRFNSWGTVVAVLLLGTGSTGLTLAGAPNWAPDVFLGVALLIAVGATVVARPKL